MPDPVSALEEGVPAPTSADAATKTPSAKGHMDQPPSLARLSSARRGPEGGKAGFGQRHGSSAYNVDREVLLNLEFVSDRLVKVGQGHDCVGSRHSMAGSAVEGAKVTWAPPVRP